ncbi:hypothetical protein CLOP_g16926 [Closterium sp. NIES-67]|nr:hypothetical protein CLOP_g16926 [Closterium sp. NIES-67]
MPIPPSERTWQQVTMDFVTGFPAKDGCNDAIFVVVDKLTKMAHFAACKKSISAKETGRLFISTVVRLYGIPLPIISYRDTKFTSNFWRNLWGNSLARACNSPPPTTLRMTDRSNGPIRQ